MFVIWGGGLFFEYVRVGKVKDIIVYMNEKNYKSRFVDVVFGLIIYNNKIWVVLVEGVGVVFIWYNKEIFKKYNLKVLKIYDEFLNIVKVLKVKGIILIIFVNKIKWLGCFWYWYFVDKLGGLFVFVNVVERIGGSFVDLLFIKVGEMF